VSGMPKETLPGIVTRSAGYNRIFSTTTGRLGQKRTPDSFPNLGFITLAMSYSRTTYRSTTIGAAAFHFRVRNGNGWGHCATVTRVRNRTGGFAAVAAMEERRARHGDVRRI